MPDGLHLLHVSSIRAGTHSAVSLCLKIDKGQSSCLHATMRRFLAAFFVGLIVSVGGNKTATWLDKRAKVRLHGPTTSLHHWPTLNMQSACSIAYFAPCIHTDL
jgi:hypothetical protein